MNHAAADVANALNLSKIEHPGVATTTRKWTDHEGPCDNEDVERAPATTLGSERSKSPGPSY